MGNLRAFPLQDYIDQYNCGYYVESGTTENSIDYALHFPFVRVYSLDSDLELVETIRQRYWFNQRVQVFHRSHGTAFYELVRIIPNEYSAVIWLADKYFPQSIEQLAQARPAKRDVLIIDNLRCSQLGDFVYISKFFGLTHSIKTALLGSTGSGIILVPNNVYLAINNE